MPIDPSRIMLTGQVAIVTGGGSGIGQGIALGLAAFGADVVIADIDEGAAANTVAQIESLGRRALSVPTDVMQADQIEAMVARTKSGFGRLDILVNNAGGVRPSPFLDLSPRSIARQTAINLGNLFEATACAARAMIEFGNGGTILNITSIEGLRAAPGFAVYAACKAAMINFTKTAAVEFSGHKIRVNVIAPDIVMTTGMARMDPQIHDPAKVEARRRYVPLGRDGNLDDCAAAAVFLASPMASYITGAILNVDGGTFAASGWVRDSGAGWTTFPGVRMHG